MKNEMNTDSWKEFDLTSLFDIAGAPKRLPSGENRPGPYPHVSSKATNNGVLEHYDYYTEKGNVLVVESSIDGYCSYQKMPFSSHGHLTKLTPKFKMDDQIALFLVTVINQGRVCYDYGRKRSMEKLKKEKILLPVRVEKDEECRYSEAGYEPDWEFMQYVINSCCDILSFRNGIKASFELPK